MDNWDFEVAGIQYIDGAYFNTEAEPWEIPDSRDLADADYVRVLVTDTDTGDSWYVHFDGPFDGYEDLGDAVDDWIIHGTPE